MTEAVVLMMTAPDEETAARIARALVESRLVACVNLLPGLRSIYRWQGAVCDEPEVLMIAKTQASRVAEVEASLTALHPYDTPELLALPVKAGAARYLDWVLAETAPETP